MADQQTGLSSAGLARLEYLEDVTEALVRNASLTPPQLAEKVAVIQAERVLASAPPVEPVSQIDVQALIDQNRELLSRLEAEQTRANAAETAGRSRRSGGDGA